MLSIIICEDDLRQRERLESTIQNYVMIENLPVEIVLSTHSPDEVLNYLARNPKAIGLYFLDVDLQHEMTGIALAARIREVDDLGKIVFVTTHGELTYLTYVYKVEAMDYIIKDQPDIERKICECISVAYKRHLNSAGNYTQMFKVKVGDVTLSIPYDEIMFFESSSTPHKLILHKENAQLEFYGSIKGLEENLPEFYRCHKSYVVNPQNIKQIHEAAKEGEMTNGEIFFISTRKMNGLKARL